jgi:hypothetical protein
LEITCLPYKWVWTAGGFPPLVAYVLGAREIAGSSVTIATWLIIIFIILATIAFIV